MPEVRRLLQLRGAEREVWHRHLHWLRWRQAHQARAHHGHTRRRAWQGATLPSPEPMVRVVPGTAPMTDARWLHIMPHLPPQKPATGRPALDHRRMVEGMLWVMRSGTAWRFLPPQFGPWQTIYSRYQRWCKDGIWQRIVAVLHTADSLPSKVGAT